MYESLWLCAEPERSIGSQRVLFVIACSGRADALPWTDTITATFNLKPVAIILFNRDHGAVALAPDIAQEHVESLLMDEARWAMNA